jgi:hypothetical protein
MAKIEISGEVAFRGEPVKYSDKFTKAEIVIKDVTSKYPEFIKFEAINDKVDMLLGMRVGMQVTAEGFLGGKEYTKKDGTIGYITSIKLAKIYENKPAAPAVTQDAVPF